jgi:hypothetical protein
MKKNIFAYLVALFSLAFVALGSHFAPEVFHLFESNSEHGLINIFFEIAVIFVLSFIIFYVSHVTKLPSFVMAIFLVLPLMISYVLWLRNEKYSVQ